MLARSSGMRAVTWLALCLCAACAPSLQHVNGPRRVNADADAHKRSSARHADADADAASLRQVHAEVDAHNRSRALRADADAARAAGGAPFKPASTTATLPGAPKPEPDSATIAGAAGQRDLISGEKLLVRTSDHAVFFTSTGCAEMDACGVCWKPLHYRYFHRPNGHVVIVRLTPVFKNRTVRVEQCSIGECGTAFARPAPQKVHVAALALGVTEPDQVEVQQVTYTKQVIVETCAHPTAIP